MSNKPEKPLDAYEVWSATLSSQARRALQQQDSTLPVPAPSEIGDEEDAYRDFRSKLSGPAATALADLSRPEQPEETKGLVALPCLVECPDGEWSVLRQFKTFDGLVRRIGQLEEEDVTVWAFFGIPLKLTKGPQRYLLLPDGVSAMQVPMYDGGPTKIVPADLLDTLEIQEDGYLGPPELASTHVLQAKLESHKTKASESGDEDEEDENEEDDD